MHFSACSDLCQMVENDMCSLGRWELSWDTVTQVLGNQPHRGMQWAMRVQICKIPVLSLAGIMCGYGRGEMGDPAPPLLLFLPSGGNEQTSVSSPLCLHQILELAVGCALRSGKRRCCSTSSCVWQIMCSATWQRVKGAKLWEVHGRWPGSIAFSVWNATFRQLWSHFCASSLPGSLGFAAARTAHSCRNAH